MGVGLCMSSIRRFLGERWFFGGEVGMGEGRGVPGL